MVVMEHKKCIKETLWKGFSPPNKFALSVGKSAVYSRFFGDIGALLNRRKLIARNISILLFEQQRAVF